MSLDTADTVTGSSAQEISPSDHSDCTDITAIKVEPLNTESEPPSTDTVYIKCEVKEENTSDFLGDTSTTNQDHGFPSCTLERETLESYSFTNHTPEIQFDTRSCSNASDLHLRLYILIILLFITMRVLV